MCMKSGITAYRLLTPLVYYQVRIGAATGVMDSAIGRPASQILSVPQTREAIAADIVLHTDHLIALQNRLNALADVSVLSTEILCRIFMYCAPGHVSGFSTSWPRPYGWVCMTHVCKHWRIVALSCTTLWVDLLVTKQYEWMVELLARSKTVPLNVIISPGGPDPSSYQPLLSGKSSLQGLQASCALFLSQIARIRSLLVKAVPADTAYVLQLLDGPAPQLESLSVIIIRSRIDGWWRTMVVPSLTHLALTSSLWNSGSHTDIEDLMGSIAHMTLLESLIIDGALTGTLGRMEALEPRFFRTSITLPHLHVLEIQGSGVHVIHILNLLHTPSLSTLHVITDYCAVPGSSSNFFAAVAIKTLSMKAFHTLVITTGPAEIFADTRPSRACLQACHNDHGNVNIGDLDKSSLRLLQNPTLEVRFSCPVADALSEFCQLLPVSDVCSLFVSGSSLSTKLWTTVLQRTINVTHLTAIGGIASDGLSDALRDRRRGPRRAGKNSGHVYHYTLPRLRLLTLSDFFFMERETDWELGGMEPLAQQLISCFIERYEYGAEIERLRILRAINLERDEIDLLKEVVRVVEWDGASEYNEKYEIGLDSDYDSDPGF
ncbi:uncharacterized protein C8Q71DRAFT_845869 [Rhodofomes roseus]|uniref:F-box domain-containing protein n=1 Tax=Rhodofomes roseus TaxID=34475 RepID=A0ABQ8KU99_9APHY|nr:uncharacterized protein C8Q71DRAFT_845869 [Rhodofomes roseus]KAH9841857.1 hypothetical protein C8Q71DRAFT_845869 [Rhodofomes roseus]